MLRVFQSTNASQAKSYYTESLARQDYYVDGQDIGACWGGLAAARMGVEGAVDQRAFAALCENRHPATGDRLTPRTRDDRTVGYDINFHAPKGVSLLHALTGDERIAEAMRSAVAATMREIEANTHTRVRLDGKSEDRHTGNLAWGQFTHHTARPVDGLPDPHLHVHCFVFNATWDAAESRWKAGQFRQVVRDHPYFQAAFHARLAGNLTEIGYPVGRNTDSWDLTQISRGLVEKFSRRTAEIEKTAKRLGVTDPGEKDTLGARTRSKKDESLSADALARIWQGRLSEDEAEWLHRIAQEPGLRGAKASPGNGVARGGQQQENERQRAESRRISADEALRHAVEHVFERKAVESDRRLAAEALKYGLSDVTPEAIWSAIDQHPDLLTRNADGERWVTTRAVLEEEKAVLAFAVEGKGTELPLGAGIGGREGERYQIGSQAERTGISLNDPQRAAVEHLLSSRDKAMILRGGAGTGKTTLMQEAAAAIQHGGKSVFACATTSDASRGVLREAGFAQAETLQKLLTDKKLQDKIQDQVIWIDEGGMVGTPTMRRVFELAEKKNTRVVIAGDIKQHAPVERGDAMGLLERQAGIRPAEVTEIIRQSGVYKDAVDAMTRGNLTEAVKHLDDLGAIREIRDPEDPHHRHEELADRYVETAMKNQSALVVSPTHAEGRAVTESIREKLKDAGRIDQEDRDFTRLKDQQWTNAEKADAHRYEPGMVVQYTQHCPGIQHRNIAPAAAGTKATVLAVDAKKGLITTEDIAGHRRHLPLSMADRFQVFKKESLGLAKGDAIRITRNGNTLNLKHRLTNGSMYKVAGFTDEGNIILNNRGKWVVHREMGHFTHGYCTTPQAAQGKSVDKCFAAISSDSLSASTVEQIYVILSRGKKSAELITDKRSSLIDAVARVDKQRAATELVAEQQPPTREQRLMAHAREVQRLKMFERQRWLMQQGRSQSGSHLGPDKRPMNRGTRGTQRWGRDGPSRSGPERQR